MLILISGNVLALTSGVDAVVVDVTVVTAAVANLVATYVLSFLLQRCIRCHNVVVLHTAY